MTTCEDAGKGVHQFMKRNGHERERIGLQHAPAPVREHGKPAILLLVAGLILITISAVTLPARAQVLFDATKAETAGNADWVINGASQRILSPPVSGVTSSTPETYWTGGLSSWGVALAKLANSGQISLAGNKIETLPSSGSITYGNASNAQDLSKYQVYVVCEPNIRFTDTEKTAILTFVKNGGSLFMVADHAGADRNNDGWDALQIWNDLLTNNTVQINPFGFQFNGGSNVSPTGTGDTSTANPITHGLGGTVSSFEYWNGSTMTINGANAHAAVWVDSTHSSSQVMAIYGTFGAGKFIATGDSSSCDDGTGESGHTLYLGWTVVDDAALFINGTVWLLSSNTNPVPPTVTTGTATAVTTNAATLNGTVNPNGQSTTAQFQYGLTTTYGSVAAVSGSLNGTNAQAVSANVTGLSPGTTYHFLVTATNASGAARGLDQTFTTATPSGVDLAISKTHAGSFTQGQTGAAYTINVTNVGSLASSGLITVTDALPTNLTATAISGTGWTCVLSNLTCTRSDAIAAGTNFQPITLTVTVATNAPASVTNTAAVSGGGDVNPANNTASDVTIINTSGGSGGASNPVISQIYGAGGNASGVSYKNDFVELFNPGSTAVNLGTWSVQYASASGSVWQVGNLNGSIQPYHYYLLELTSGGTYGAALPTSDATNTINISATSGKLALVSSQTALSGSNPIGASDIVDFVGYGSPSAYEGPGAAPGGGDTTSTLRKNGGYTDSTNNVADFTTLTPPAPRNSASPANPPPPTPVADLAVFLTHAGSFTQADLGDTYTIIVTNSGAAATLGSVSVADTLPSGLMPTAIAGTGWTSNLSTLTCTRSDPLTAGASYPPITVTVSVATNAPASLTNLVTVSGGGETNLLNNTASDPTAIIILTPIQAWRFQWFGTIANSGAASDTAIATSDGMPNLLKYALGLNPLVPAGNPLTCDINTGHLRLISLRNPDATDVTLSAAVTGDVMGSWATNGTTVDPSTPNLFQAHDNTSVDAAPERLMRLRVTRP